MIPPKSAIQINYSKFVYFHPSTRGQAGRAVYIDPQLLVRFMELVDTSVAKGEQVARGMIALQSTAAGTTSDSNKSCAFQHRQTIQNIVVTYSVLQNGGRRTGVYITDLQHGYASDEGRPGLYKVEPNYGGRTRWRAIKEDGLTLSSLVGVLGALPPSEEGIVDPEMTASAFAKGPLRNERTSSGFSLFYTPTYAIDQMGVWLTSSQKCAGGAISSPQKFAQILAAAANKPKGHGPEERYKWYVVGQGAKVFQQALPEYKRLSKQPLNNRHDFYFVDPQVPLGLLEKDLRDNGIHLSRDKSIVEGSMGAGSQTHQLVDPAQTYSNMYKPWKKFLAVNDSVKNANKVLRTSSSSTVCFSDLVKKLTTALNGSW